MIYLNNAATSYPKPQCVLTAHAAALAALPQSQFRSLEAGAGEDIFTRCRQKLGGLLGIRETERIFFSSGATDSLNTLLCGLEMNRKRIVTTATEHNSVLRPLYNQRCFRDTEIVTMSCDKNGWVNPADMEREITEETGAVIVNHCSNVTGMVQDIKAIGQITGKTKTLFIVDASQSAGCLPIDADSLGIDALVFTGHKSLFGIQGTGGYYVRQGVKLLPFRYGGTGKDSSLLRYGQEDYEYEPGTQNAPGIAALYAGISYILDRGIETIAAKEHLMMQRLYNGLEEMPGVILYGNAQNNKGPVMSFNIEGLSASDAAYILQNAYGIVVRTGLHCTPLIHKAIGSASQGTVRISISDLTKEEEIESLLAAVTEITASLERRGKY